MENEIILSESNVLDIYKKLSARESVSKEELDDVLKRFNQLVCINDK